MNRWRSGGMRDSMDEGAHIHLEEDIICLHCHTTYIVGASAVTICVYVYMYI